MNIITLDFETYFDAEYTLKKLTVEEYVRDPRFEVLGCGIRWPDGKLEWFEHPADISFPDGAAFLCHHAQFDGFILSHHYGVKPLAWLDTLSMARLLIGNHVSGSLDSLSKHFGLAGKNIDYTSFKGKHWSDLEAEERNRLADGCLQDVRLTYDIFTRLASSFPVEEYTVVDATVRMFTEPLLVGDINLLGKIWSSENERKRNLLDDLDIDVADVQSASRFVDLLHACGVEVPTKEGKNGPIPCVARTDEFMKELLDAENPRTRGLAEARLGVRSTIDQTRAERLGFMGQRGSLPVYLGYAGAHTTRWSGGDKVNWQNLRRGGELRKAICAPPGHKIIKADKSQIECRILEAVAGEDLQDFRENKDPYIDLASQFYGRDITKENKEERQFGKVMRLQCGYGAGAASIVRAARRAAIPVIISEEEGLKARDIYRANKQHVVALWREANRMIARLAGGEPIAWRCTVVREGKIILPNGCPLLYPDLEYFEDYWRYKSRQGWVKIYGAKLVENVVQALSRIDLSQTLLRLLPYGLRPVLLEHDAAAFVVLDKDVEQAQELIQQEFCRAPVWLPDLPLDCEITTGERYA